MRGKERKIKKKEDKWKRKGKKRKEKRGFKIFTLNSQKNDWRERRRREKDLVVFVVEQKFVCKEIDPQSPQYLLLNFYIGCKEICLSQTNLDIPSISLERFFSVFVYFRGRVIRTRLYGVCRSVVQWIGWDSFSFTIWNWKVWPWTKFPETMSPEIISQLTCGIFFPTMSCLWF